LSSNFSSLINNQFNHLILLTFSQNVDYLNPDFKLKSNVIPSFSGKTFTYFISIAVLINTVKDLKKYFFVIIYSLKKSSLYFKK